MILRWSSGAKSLVMIDKLGNGAACAPFRPQKFEENTLQTSYGNTLLLNEKFGSGKLVSWHKFVTTVTYLLSL